LVGVVVAAVNATSGILEARRAEWDVHWAEPVVWEVSSAIVIIAMAPLIGWAMQRWPVRGDNLAASGLTHLALTIPFSLIHILAIWIMRESAYWAVGARYGFFDDDGVAITILYEWRKDVLTYGAIAAVYWWRQRAEERPPPERPGDERIEIRDGATAVFLASRDLLVVEAAGNYITFNAAARTYLVRGTLASWQTRLAAQGFVRVHRSRLVNRARISSIKPTPAGDFEITLDDGRTVLGSRRYRDALETTPSA
jgi:hypothetical protein